MQQHRESPSDNRWLQTTYTGKEHVVNHIMGTLDTIIQEHGVDNGTGFIRAALDIAYTHGATDNPAFAGDSARAVVAIREYRERTIKGVV
jgi:hypothetical protein